MSRDGVCCVGADAIAYAFRKSYVSGILANRSIEFVCEGTSNASDLRTIHGEVAINRCPSTSTKSSDGHFTFRVAGVKLFRRGAAMNEAAPDPQSAQTSGPTVSISDRVDEAAAAFGNDDRQTGGARPVTAHAAPQGAGSHSDAPVITVTPPGPLPSDCAPTPLEAGAPHVHSTRSVPHGAEGSAMVIPTPPGSSLELNQAFS